MTLQNHYRKSHIELDEGDRQKDFETKKKLSKYLNTRAFTTRWYFRVTCGTCFK